ncbi:MAG: TVP38/TMEM64 family protein [Ectothiorhodospiraceae bacterium]|nr:TVP38/TMEM64 family protein [Ectothiorhodospiraceae bacterium]
MHSDNPADDPASTSPLKHHRTLWFSLALIALGVVYYLLFQNGFITLLENGDALKDKIQSLGMAGPALIIAAMVLAIIMSPIPSAPIALAAGALYGHTTGTIYILIGAELGAIIAFFIARILGINVLQQWMGNQLAHNLLGSQQKLMAIVFFSRLLPFISFDIISYAAGLTALSFWRFAIATLAGIAPASFLLAHLGAEMSTGESNIIAYTLLGFSLISVLLFLANKYRKP